MNSSHKRIRYLYFFAFVTAMVIFTSCVPDDSWEEIGLAPIYVSPDNYDLIKSTEPRESIDQGAFLEIYPYIYINDRFTGIHVFDNQDPANPSKMFFWEIPGNTEFTISGDFLYADNSRHLLTIDISDPANIFVVSAVEDIYTPNMENNNFPLNYSGRFERTDFEKGIVVDWEERLLDSPRCYIL